MKMKVRPLVSPVDQALSDRILKERDQRLACGAWFLRRRGAFPLVPQWPEEPDQPPLLPPYKLDGS